MDYFLPKEPEKPETKVWVKGYEIKNKTSFHKRELEGKEGVMSLELTFFSNDYSPAKYEKFLKEFIEFLNEKGY